MVALGPFVPGIEEHDGFGESVEGGSIGQHRTKPMAVCIWCGAVDDGGTAMTAARRVVPGWGDAGEAGIGHWRASQHGGNHVGVGEHPVGAEWMGAGQAELVEELPAEGWL